MTSRRARLDDATSLPATKGCARSSTAVALLRWSFCKHAATKPLSSGDATPSGRAGGSPKQMAHMRAGQLGVCPGGNSGYRPLASSMMVTPRLHTSAA